MGARRAAAGFRLLLPQQHAVLENPPGLVGREHRGRPDLRSPQILGLKTSTLDVGTWALQAEEGGFLAVRS